MPSCMEQTTLMNPACAWYLRLHSFIDLCGGDSSVLVTPIRLDKHDCYVKTCLSAKRLGPIDIFANTHYSTVYSTVNTESLNMAAVSVPPLVSTEWLSNALSEHSSSSSSSVSSSIRVLDATWLGIMSEGRDAYRTEHIHGAVHFDLNQCRDETSRLNFTLPSAQDFAKYAGELGIDNNTHVIVYENDPIFRMMSAPRTWWMFRLFCHDKVSVLDGGLKQWKSDGYAVETGDQPVVDQRVFSSKPANPSLIKHFDEVLENQKTEKFALIDSRPPEWFDGSMASIWPELPLGYILKSINVPFGSIVRTDSDRMVAREDIFKLFQSAGIDLTQPVVCSCFVGISACTVALAAFMVGKEDVAIYDGSWDEFCKRAPKDSHVIIPYPKL